MAHQHRKRFGQHFLHDQNIIDRIIHAINPQLNDKLVEIGAGEGVLTKELVNKVNQLDVIEIDRDLVSLLKQEFAEIKNITIHQGDILQLELSKLIKNPQELRIVGNLPYNISTPLLFHLFKQASMIKDMHFMLQKEVVDRLSARPSTKNYGRLSVMAQYHCQIESLFIVSPLAFDPPPKVQSAVVRLIPFQKLPITVENHAVFKQIVMLAFNQRRKTLNNSLRTAITSAQLLALGIDPQARAENISVAEYAAIANSLSSSG